MAVSLGNGGVYRDWTGELQPAFEKPWGSSKFTAHSSKEEPSFKDQGEAARAASLRLVGTASSRTAVGSKFRHGLFGLGRVAAVETAERTTETR